MRITILTVPECPNAPLMHERLVAALDGRPAQIDLIEVGNEAEAEQRGMHGSPTVLLDGLDPFAPAGTAPSMSCRLYRDAEGRTEGVPSMVALQQALTGRRSSPTTDEECCATDAWEVISRDGRGRLAPAERGLRAVHQAVLRHFASTGNPPPTAVLEPLAAQNGRSAEAVLSELAREDFLVLGEAGRIEAAYPFSAVETRHRIRLANGVEVWAMCAIDALGIAAMLGQNVDITSCDPVDGRPVTVSVTGDRVVWKPADAVVFLGRWEGAGPAAAVCCGALNFFTSPSSAERWQRQHPEVVGQVVSQARAWEVGQQTFGPLLQNG